MSDSWDVGDIWGSAISTKMTEADWEVALEVFRLCLPARGARAKDDRLFLEARHYFAVHNITCRALPERFGRWNSIWRRFHRLSRAGVFEDFFATLADLSGTAHLVQVFDSTVTRAHVSAAGAKGGSTVRPLGARAAASAPERVNIQRKTWANFRRNSTRCGRRAGCKLAHLPERVAPISHAPSMPVMCLPGLFPRMTQGFPGLRGRASRTPTAGGER